MKKLLHCMLALLLTLSLACTTFAAETGTAADLLFTGGIIYTVDAQDTIAQALAVQDGKIIFVGSDEEAQAYKGADTQVIDLEGKFMMPGLIDSHIHTMSMSLFELVVVGLTSLDETLEAIQAHVDEHPEKEAYLGFGYMTNLFTGEEADKGPRKERLDEIVSDKPISIISFDGHAMWANSKFFELHGITSETESPRGGILEIDEATGEVWGTLKDAAIALGGDIQYDPARLDNALREFQAGLNAHGYTSIMTLPGFGIMPIPFDGFIALEEAGELTLKVHGATSIMDWSQDADIERMLQAKESYNTNMVKMNTAKFFMDGVLDAHTAFMLEPYTDMPDSYGMAGWDLEVLQDVYTKVNEAGVQIHTHAIGDAALRLSLDAMEYAKANAPEGDYRNAITHLQMVNEDDIPRLGELGVVAVAQPYWHYRQPHYWDVVEYAAVGERAEREYPMKSFLDTGAVLAASSDFPVTADPNPFYAMQLGVTRNLISGPSEVADYGIEALTDMDDPTYLLWPEERVTIQDMIRSFTASGAYLTFSDDETGTLEVGKAADLAIIDQNLLEIDPLQIEFTQVLQTYIDGKLVYDAAE